jgi:hypothetical protein
MYRLKYDFLRIKTNKLRAYKIQSLLNLIYMTQG